MARLWSKIVNLLTLGGLAILYFVVEGGNSTGGYSLAIIDPISLSLMVTAALQAAGGAGAAGAGAGALGGALGAGGAAGTAAGATGLAGAATGLGAGGLAGTAGGLAGGGLAGGGLAGGGLAGGAGGGLMSGLGEAAVAEGAKALTSKALEAGFGEAAKGGIGEVVKGGAAEAIKGGAAEGVEVGATEAARTAAVEGPMQLGAPIDTSFFPATPAETPSVMTPQQVAQAESMAQQLGAKGGAEPLVKGTVEAGKAERGAQAGRLVSQAGQKVLKQATAKPPVAPAPTITPRAKRAKRAEAPRRPEVEGVPRVGGSLASALGTQRTAATPEVLSAILARNPELARQLAMAMEARRRF